MSEKEVYWKRDMFNVIMRILQEKNVLAHKNNSVLICTAADENGGFDLAEAMLARIVDRKSVLYLSGGKTPKRLYTQIAKKEQIIPGAVGLIDERYGGRFHSNSNEKMIRETGLLRYFEILDIPFFPILHQEKSREETALAYDEKYRSLLSTFSKHVGILGIGEDGHTAGIPSLNSNLKSQISKIHSANNFVTEYNYMKVKYGERVTMTFAGLSMLDVLLVLVFGSAKRNVLKMVFSEGSEEEVPGRFYKRPEIAKKTILITDQV